MCDDLGGQLRGVLDGHGNEIDDARGKAGLKTKSVTTTASSQANVSFTDLV